MTCNALRPGHHDMPPRCGRIDNHDGPHRSSEGTVACVRVDPDEEWANEDVTAAEPGRWRWLRRSA